MKLHTICFLSLLKAVYDENTVDVITVPLQTDLI
jgi:hypothetical protein